MSERTPKKKEYRIPCSWECYGIMHIEAESVEEAKEKAINEEPLPDAEYSDGSFVVDEELLEYFLEEDGNLEPPYEGFGIPDEEEIK